MRIRIVLLSALAAVAASAFAAPATASASVWLYEGNEVVEPTEEVGIGGDITWWVTKGRVIGCDIEAGATLDAEGQGEITRFDLVNCGWKVWEGGGLPCPISYVTPPTLPWSFDAVSGSKALIDNVKFDYKFTFPCSGGNSISVDLPITPVGNPEYTTAFEFSGVTDGGASIFGDLTTTVGIGVTP